MGPTETDALLPARRKDDAAGLSGFSVRLDAEVDEGFEELVAFPEHLGQSTFSQALYNAIGDLVGTGLLATPLAIAYTGWVLGPCLLVFLAFVTHRTLLVLCRVALQDPSLHTFPQIIGRCFEGKFNIRPWLTTLFVFEMIAWTVALVILFSDTLEVLVPALSSNEWKLVSFFIIVPTTFLPLHLLSFTSLLGIFSSFLLVAIVFVNGFTSTSSPGSILHPAPTEFALAPLGWGKVGVSLGLIMSGFGGHAVMPTIVRDMKDTSQWRKLVDISYIVALAVCAGVGAAGYLMFGENVSDEISRDLSTTPGASQVLTTISLWMVAINPITKTPMGFKLLNDIIELAMDTFPSPRPSFSSTRTTPRPSRPSSPKPTTHVIVNEVAPSADGQMPDVDEELLRAWRGRERRKAAWRILTRISAVAVIIGVSIVFPSFETLLAFMGALPAFIVSIILPLLGKKYLFEYRTKHNDFSCPTCPSTPSSSSSSSSFSASSSTPRSTAPELAPADAPQRFMGTVESAFDWALIAFGVVAALVGTWCSLFQT